MTPQDPVWPNFVFLSLWSLVLNMCAKFEVSSFNCSRDMVGSQNFKNRSRDPFPTPNSTYFLFYRQFPRWSICVPNLKFLAQTVPEIRRGPKIWKAGHVTHSRPLWLNFVVISLLPLVVNLHAKFEVSSSNHFQLVPITLFITDAAALPLVSLRHRKVAQSPYAKPEVSVKIRSFLSRFYWWSLV